MVRIIIAGSRNFNDYRFLEQEMIKLIYNLGQKYPNQHLYEINSKTKTFTINPNFIEIISGVAEGADTLGIRFANKWHLPLKEFPAQWNDFSVDKCKIKINKQGNKYNALAGINRNEEMAKYAQSDDAIGILALFWDGKSKGSKSMKSISKKRNIDVYEYIVKERNCYD